MLSTNHTIIPSATPYLPRNHNSAAWVDNAWLKKKLRQLPNHAATSDRLWREARAYRKFCERHEPQEAARLYLSAFPNHAPDAFHTTGYQRKGKAKAALQPTGWATRLFDQLRHPHTPAYFYSLKMTHLGLPVDYSDPRFMFYPLVIQEIKAAIAARVPAPYYWKLEVGKDGAAHIHLIAGQPDHQLAHLAHPGSKVIQPIRPGTESTLLAYLSKPTAPWTAANYEHYLSAKATKQTATLPRLSGLVGVSRQRKNQS